ncbi:MAG: hypothetical protein Q8K32_14200 [Archangium sp.]|nr:hypothetical protein [Archangium sp.]
MRALLSSIFILISFPALAGELGDAKMQRAHKAASTVVRERMAQERPADAAVLQNVESADIVVVSGEYDRVEDVLKTLAIKHTVVRPEQVGGLQLNAKQLLIVDCPGNLDAAGIERVRKFVNAGGYLYTTDWALLEVVQKAFPGYVEFNGQATQNDVVEVQVKESDNNLLKHLTLSKENPKWWLEASSYPIRILNKDKVDVLITSREMKTKYGDAPIAVHFRYGDGQVLHIASHFYLQQNQTRTVADAKKSSAYLKEDTALSPSTKKALEGNVDFADDVVAGDLSSAYAAQQMTSNIVVERKKDQGRIESLYGKTIKAAPPAPPKGGAALGVGTRVKELERKDGQVKVRTMEGDERWVPASSL